MDDFILETVIVKTSNDVVYGLLKTTMYPCEWFVGQVFSHHNPLPVYNGTSLFHKTLPEALAEFKERTGGGL